MRRVIVELRVPSGAGMEMVMQSPVARVQGFQIDQGYTPVPVERAGSVTGSGEQVVIIRGTVEEDAEPALRSAPGVVGVWSDARVEPFAR
jgi:hypothetical protein